MKALILTFCIPFILISCFYSRNLKQSPEEKLIREIHTILQDSLLTNALVGAYIESLPDSHVIFKKNEKKLFIPASNQKLYTTAVALEKLGPSFQYTSQIYYDGFIQDSTLHGNLLVRGMGDPSISGTFHDNDPLAVFNQWADSLKNYGISKIAGNLHADDGYFTDAKLGYGWWWDDESYCYSAQIGALSFNNNSINLRIEAGENEGDRLILHQDPASDYIKIENNTVTLKKDSSSTLKVSRERAKNRVIISGGLPVLTSSDECVTVENPALWFITMFNSVLKNRGIEQQGDLIVNDSTYIKGNWKKLFLYKSPELKDLVKIINKDSDNFYAEQLYKTMGAVYKDEGSAEKGGQVITEWLNGIGVGESNYITKDGSGLSRGNLVSPVATAKLLRYMYKSDNFKYFYESLPIAGVDGTLEKRMRNGPAQGVLKAKTGYVSHVRNLAGYTKDRFGNDYIFVLMVNHYSIQTSYINNLQDAIGILLSSYDPR